MKFENKIIFLVIFSSHCPMQIWSLKAYDKDILITIVDSSLKLGQLIEDNE